MILGGSTNIASGQLSLAAGYVANAATSGTFVWSDFSSGTAFTSTIANSFIIRAVGGVGIGTASPAALLSVGSSSQFQVNTSGAVTATAFSGGNLTGSASAVGGITVTGTPSSGQVLTATSASAG